MHTRLARIVVLAVALLTPFAAAVAEVQVQIHLGLPAVLPPLVEVQPGMRVIQGYDEEIFFIDGYYWVVRDGRWYRARDHRRTWTMVRPDRLPPMLVRHEPGRYRQWRPEEHRGPPPRAEPRRAGQIGGHWGAQQGGPRVENREVRRQPPREVRQERGRPPPQKAPPLERPGRGREGDGHDGERHERGR